MGIFCKGKIKGEKGEFETEVFLNSGADYVALPMDIAEKISPKLVGKEEFVLGDGSIVRRNVYQVEVEIEDHKGVRKSCESFATVEKRPDVLVGLDAMKKLKLILNIPESKAYFQD